jgi:hypothetical protein
VPVKVVSEMLGHASVTITRNLYMYILPSMQRAAAEAMESLFARGLQPTGKNYRDRRADGACKVV